jgi:hypothetical protein
MGVRRRAAAARILGTGDDAQGGLSVLLLHNVGDVFGWHDD